jgi:hypothetical protein
MIYGKTLSPSPKTKRKMPTLSENPSPLQRLVPKRRRKSTSKSKLASTVPNAVVVDEAVVIVEIVVEIVVAVVVVVAEFLRLEVVKMVVPTSTLMTRPPSLP